jgi:hypothetical protein
LATIADPTQGSCGGGSGACIDPAFGVSHPGRYWSATTDLGGYSVSPFDLARYLRFGEQGGIGGGWELKPNSLYVRAVRGGQ